MIDICIREEGNYPLGQNACWHGGIHCHHIEDKIYPQLNGKIIACKIQKDYYKIPFLEMIDHEEYMNLNPEEQLFYNGDSKSDEDFIHMWNDADQPLEREYSTSYVLLSHRVSVPQKEHEANLDINFFSLYMHLSPYENDRQYENLTSFELPFYLRWNTITVRDITRQVKVYVNNPDDRKKLYHETKLLLMDERIFHQNYKFDDQTSLPIKTITGKESDDILNINVSKQLIHFDEAQLHRNKNISPKGAEKIPLYAKEMRIKSEEEKQYHFLGNIKNGLSDYTVQSTKSDSDYQWMKNENYIKIILRNIQGAVVDCPVGILAENIVLEKVPNQNSVYSVLETSWLYNTIMPDRYIGMYKLVPIETYIAKDRAIGGSYENRLTDDEYKNTLRRLNQLVFIDDKEMVLICNEDKSLLLQRQSFGIIDHADSTSDYDTFMVYQNEICNDIKHQVHKAMFNPYVYEQMESQYNVDFYKLKRQTKLYQGQTILKTNASVPSGFVEAQIFFDPSSDNTAIVKADQFTLSDEIAGTLTIPDAYIDNFPDTYFPETGIPCVDQNGYIRGLLIEEEGKDVTFKLVSGNLQENAGLSISEISGFKQDLIGKITYNETDMLLDGEAEINDDICDTNDDDGACVLTNEHEADSHTLLGFSGNYDNLKNFFHYELFFLDNNLVDDLFAGRYIYNRYKIKNLTGIYKKTYDDTAETLFFPTQMQWTAEAEHGYTKIVLKKMRVYYRPEDCEKKVVDAEGNVSWEIAEGAKNAVGLLRVKNTACHARLYNTEFAFAQMEGETRNPLNEIPNDKFKRYVELLNGENTIADKEFLFEYLDGNYLGLKFEQSDIDLSSFTFWISNDDLSNKFTPSEDNLYASKEIPEKILNIYLQNPGKPKMEKVTATDITDVNAIPELMESDFQKYELDDKTYWGFQHNSQTYYLSDADKVNQVDVNMLNFSQPENNPFFVKDTDTHDDIYCDDEKIKELCGEQFDYKHDFLISSMLRNKLSKYACNFPMEWNADLYKLCKEDADCGRCPVRMLRNECTCFPKQLDDKGFDVRYAPRIARMKQKADVWNEVAELKDSGKKSIWHFHPVYFAEHMKQFNTSFNPYENYSYNFTVGSAQDANSPREPKSDTAKSNPGFAPRVDKGNYEDGPVHNGEYYPECTSPYGIGRFGSEWRHSGIDLGTKGKSQPIKSFIYGEVWACIEDVVQFGNVMIIKNLNEPKVYFLAHLADDGFIKKENERFKPGDTVAMAGGTGGTGTDGKKITYEIHLHLEVFLMTAGAEEKREALNDSYKTSKNRTIFLKDTLVAKRVDPFNHSPDTFITDWQWRE